MPANTFAGNMVSAGASVVNPSEDSLACEAFRSAAERWCADKDLRKKKASADQKAVAARRGGFNDYFFYRSLAARDRSVASGIKHEVAGMFTGRGNNRRFLGTLEQVAAGSGRAGKARQAAAAHVLGVMQGTAGHGATGAAQGALRGADRMRGKAMSNFYKWGGVPARLKRMVNRFKPKKWSNIRFQDGVMSDGRCVELTGPGDKPRPGQLEDAKQMGAARKWW